MHDCESSNFGLNASELSGFETRLRALTPHWRLDRDRLMFAAGERASAWRFRTRTRFYGGLSATLAILLAVAVVMPRELEPSAVESLKSTADFATHNLLPSPDHTGGGNAASVSGEVFVARSASTRFEQVQRLERDSIGTREAVSADSENEANEAAPPPSTSRGLLHRYLNVAT
jgi:hypothetical protein